MNGGHDLGGMHGLGPIDPEPEASEPVFHAPWEERVFALTLAAGFLGQWNLDKSRHARERQHPADYLRNTYYENWLAGLETLLLESGLVSEQELRTGLPDLTSAPTNLRVLHAEDVEQTLSKGGPTLMQSDLKPAFKPGDSVIVSADSPSTHTRVPSYVRGRRGQVHSYHGVHVYADQHALGIREGQPLYSVGFPAESLWGANAQSPSTIYVDLWEPHLTFAQS